MYNKKKITFTNKLLSSILKLNEIDDTFMKLLTLGSVSTLWNHLINQQDNEYFPIKVTDN